MAGQNGTHCSVRSYSMSCTLLLVAFLASLLLEPSKGSPTIPTCAGRPDGECPNIVFLIDESTDGRTYREGFAPAVSIPNVRKLLNRRSTVQFDTHYANAPVCCPSRASLWSGRQPHRMPHQQAANKALTVNGAWNNYEGNPSNYKDLLGDVLDRRGYATLLSGKTDWTTGGHSLNVRLNSWTMYTRFPYNVNTSGGWYDETECPSAGTVADNDEFYRHSDWKVVNSTTAWIRQQATQQRATRASQLANGLPIRARPFFAYQGMNIVHPAYATNRHWYSKINVSLVTVPEWRPLMELHPCDLQSSMLKKCVPADKDAASFYSIDRRKHIRSIYYAMIAEFDAMVGAYIAAVDDAGVSDNTVIIVTSDHGDMNMEHQQFYKMVQYDASARVPLLINTPWDDSPATKVVKAPTSHIDLFPTISEFAGVPAKDLPSVLDGQSLVPFLQDPASRANPTRPPHSSFVVSQFHGCNIAMSWFLAMDGRYKYVVFGTGKEVPAQLFDLSKDADEMNNIAASMPDLVATLDAKLRTVIDYPVVANDVAKYNQDSFRAWQQQTPDWQNKVATGRWADPFGTNRTASLAAIADWLSSPPSVQPCRHELVWPPPSHESPAVPWSQWA